MKGLFVVLMLLAVVFARRRPEEKTITGIRRIGLFTLNNPETIIFSDDGYLYTGLNDGSIHKVDPAAGTHELYARVVPGLTEEQIALCGTSVIYEPLCGRPLGMAFDEDNNIVVMDAYHGIKLVHHEDPSIVDTLVGSVEGVPIKFGNSILLSSDGDTIYFTDSSQAFVRYQFLSVVLKNTADARLMKFDKVTGEVTVLVDGLRFANGLAFGPDENSILVMETSTRSMYKYIIGGCGNRRFRKIRTFDCYPDNITPTPDGNYLVGCFGPEVNMVSLIQEDERLSDLVLQYVPPTEILASIPPQGIIKKVNHKGRLLAEYTDETGGVVAAIAEAHEHNGKLYIGSVVLPYLGEIDMATQLE